MLASNVQVINNAIFQVAECRLDIMRLRLMITQLAQFALQRLSEQKTN